MLRLTILATIVAACGPDALQAVDPPACGPWRHGGWDPRFEVPGLDGVDGFAGALVRLPDGRIAVGGSFDHAPGTPLRNVGAWDGARWTPLGDGLPAPVRALAIDDTGVLWAAGTRSGPPVSYVARWDGRAWIMIADNIDGRVGLVAVDGGIAVFGDFATIGRVEAHGLAVWNGAWTPRGLDASQIVTLVSTVTRTPDGFCIGGRFATATLAPREGAACWDGVTWTALGDLRGVPQSLARGPDGRWWAGNLTFVDGDQVAHGMATLGADGRWELFAALDTWASIAAIQFDDDRLTIAGRFSAVGPDRVAANGLARWSPETGWRGIAARPAAWPTTIHALLADGPRLHLAGRFDGFGDTSAANVATIEADETVTAWRGEHVALGTQAWVTALVDSPWGLVVTGAVVANGVGNPAAVFDGATWQPLPALPTSPRTARDAVVLPDGAIVLAGERVWRLDGMTWTRLVDDNHDRPIAIDGEGHLYATRGTATGAELGRLDGRTFTSLGEVAGEILAMTVYDGALAVLARDQARSRVSILRDGTSTVIRDAPEGAVDLAVSPIHGLVVTSSTGIDAWAGGTWRSLTPDATSAISACRDGVFAATSRFVDDRFVSRIGFHDGTAWTWLPEASEQVTALVPTADGLYVGVSAATSAIQRWSSSVQ